MTRAAKQYHNREFEVGDIAEDVDCDKRTVRRVLNELTDLGYLTKRETKKVSPTAIGQSRSRASAKPICRISMICLRRVTGQRGILSGEEAPDHPDESPSSISITGIVWVVGVDSDAESSRRSARATLPAPEG